MSRRPLVTAIAWFVLAAAVVATSISHTQPAAAGAHETFADAGREATSTLLHVFYAGRGLWRECDGADCRTANVDWGVDSLTYALALRWRTTHDPDLVPVLRELAATAPTYPEPCADVGCPHWSDVPEWDAIALVREYEATHDPQALAKAETAFAFVERSRAYALGACPRIRYQQPGGGGNHLKTLETDANAIKAALLLYRATGSSPYLTVARRRYDAVRAYFLDPKVALYSVYVFDDGHRCSQLPHRFFASVNGDMIWSGVELHRATGLHRYLDEALLTARAVEQRLADPNGMFANLQAENDIVEPLVEAMYEVTTQVNAEFARRWILRNAAAALSARASNGAFGRFFDGPRPSTTTTAWQTNGGLALAIAAAAMAPRRPAPSGDPWVAASLVPREIGDVPAALRFRGSGIALLGTLGERCCESGHARVFVDGRETFDHTGIWQNKSSSGRTIPNTVLFAWRWPRRGVHTIRFEPGVWNGKEGDSFLHVQAHLVLP
jgi:hypothetical protein